MQNKLINLQLTHLHDKKHLNLNFAFLKFLKIVVNCFLFKGSLF
jgi:hypothetical protein